MSVFLYAILVYWGVCATLLIGLMFVGCTDDEQSRTDQQKWEMLRLAPSPWREIAIALGLLFIVLISPLAAPCWFIPCYLQARREAALIAKLSRTHRENIFERIHPVRLPTIARRYFEEHQSELFALDFQPIGRYVLKPEPVPSYGYCFQSPDQRALFVLGQMFDDTYFSISTLFANGMCLETASVEETPELARVNQSAMYRVAFVPGATLAEAYARHEQEITTIEQEFDTHAMAFEPDQFRDVLTYEGRVHSQLLYEWGEHDAPPPSPVRPTAIGNDFAAPVCTDEVGQESPALVAASD